ncbi:MAG: ABC transporter [Bacteroidetes bacterium QS_8_68_15]|nr:MAG: ABC transporter [Bacteroidetes bacterium QS_8_68_15]
MALDDDPLRSRVLTLLDEKGARRPFATATEGVPPDVQGRRPEAIPYSPWELVEHARLAQRDILDYCRPAPGYEQPDWPADYWPPTPAPPSTDAWDESRSQFAEDRRALKTLIEDTDDLHAPVPHTAEETHTYLRQALLVADHTSYHTGQIVAVRRLLDCWPPASDRQKNVY